MTGFRRRHALRKRYGAGQTYVVCGFNARGQKEYIGRRPGEMVSSPRYAWQTGSREEAEREAANYGEAWVETYRKVR
jgi:hypothetical protein